MSNGIRYDSLLSHYLALELDRELRRRRLRSLSLDRERRIAVFEFDDLALSWSLHPTGGWLQFGRAPITPDPVDLSRQSRVWRVDSPSDERLITIELSTPARRPGRVVEIVVELVGDQWNLLGLDPSGRIAAALWPRRAGERRLWPGQLYEAPPPSGRRGIGTPLGLEEWEELVEGIEGRELRRRLISEVAYLSPINTGPILGESEGGTEESHTHYLGLARLPDAEPRLLELGERLQPYPLPLPGIDDVPYPTLLAAFDALSRQGESEGELEGSREEVSAIPLELLAGLRQRLERLERRKSRLEAEVEEAVEDTARLRGEADLLMANLHRLRKGMVEVELDDWEGGQILVALDPALDPSENARSLYDEARRRERAAEEVPGLIAEVDAETEALGALLERAEAGEATLQEIEGALPQRRPAERGEEVELPYLRYRTTGGLEVRVGRSSKANDELTFHHSSPEDIWLHARGVGGGHVILRWGHRESNPSARDIAEAANLASLHSRARSSGVVPVDWTRRKYVRKPRKSAPGQVVFEREKTVFVEPDPGLERRLRR